MELLCQEIKSGNVSYIKKINRELRVHLTQHVQHHAFGQAKRKDHLSTTLIPSDVPSLFNESVAFETTGNGNCLFNSTSLFLQGDESLADCLHMLTSCVLYINANDYTISKPKMKEVLSRANAHDSVYVHILLSNDAFDKYQEQKNLIKAIQYEALFTCVHYR